MADTVRGLIASVLRQAATRHQVLHDVRARWAEVVGPEVAQHTRPVRLSRGRLFVHVDHSADGFLLGYHQPALLEKLAAWDVREIVVRVGGGRDERAKAG